MKNGDKNGKEKSLLPIWTERCYLSTQSCFLLNDRLTGAIAGSRVGVLNHAQGHAENQKQNGYVHIVASVVGCRFPPCGWGMAGKFFCNKNGKEKSLLPNWTERCYLSTQSCFLLNDRLTGARACSRAGVLNHAQGHAEQNWKQNGHVHVVTSVSSAAVSPRVTGDGRKSFFAIKMGRRNLSFPSPREFKVLTLTV